jgi:hypothetical protein
MGTTLSERPASIFNTQQLNRPSVKEKTMSDQVNRNPQHTDAQKPGSEQKPGSPPNHPVQEKQQNESGQSKSPQPEQGRNDQEKKKQA